MMRMQLRAWDWLCGIGSQPNDVQMRCRRFMEEASELVQALGMPEDKAIAMVRDAYSRPVGEVSQEFGGAGLTLFALAGAVGDDLGLCIEVEMTRVERPEVKEKIRLKNKIKMENGL